MDAHIKHGQSFRSRVIPVSQKLRVQIALNILFQALSTSCQNNVGLKVGGTSVNSLFQTVGELRDFTKS